MHAKVSSLALRIREKHFGQEVALGLTLAPHLHGIMTMSRRLLL
jgi:hypothetical protein